MMAQFMSFPCGSDGVVPGTPSHPRLFVWGVDTIRAVDSQEMRCPTRKSSFHSRVGRLA